MAEFAVYRPLLSFLRDSGYPTEHRGEQTYCLAIKRARLPSRQIPCGSIHGVRGLTDHREGREQDREESQSGE